ncbi:UDP-N-acetylmuramoyl-tripeptide--D-alanyl-D-alanine ligase [Millisia brevis]|uniref:UDP-N-acetylmuramoyl-tripeptide--D-alanyl-D- alanine ligase n=1 Tax=Millisia brevis TaxID=264148 RepID=UPI00082C0976|nr:UDP-N-acetylmuramoyl-tripeptide--D-alanyl-D-alanine ligase [Millisia brevis]
MIPMTLAQIAAVIGGRLADAGDGSATVTGAVEFDSRVITPGDLFLALPGARVDGHDHAAGAVAAGAIGVLAARPVGVPAIVVDPVPTDSRAMALESDTDGSGAAVLAALGRLARYVTDRLIEDGLTVVGVTGSAGKTSTKDLIAAVLRAEGPTVAPPGSMNNELGHPWTALRADEKTRFLVLELSARHEGNIRDLTRIVAPRIGAVLNVGSAHLGEFGSREAIARTKGELVEALPAAADGGVAILNADDPLVAAMADRTAAAVVRVGRGADADVRAEDVTVDESARAAFTLVADGRRVPVRLRVHGEHQVPNSLTAAAVGRACGLDLEVIAAALSAAEAASIRRMAVATRADGLTVVDDSYNANPESVAAALKALATMVRTRRDAAASTSPDAGPTNPFATDPFADDPFADRPAGPRAWAVLGEMRELGDESIREHDRIGRLVVRLDIDRLVVVGTDRPLRAMHQGAVMEGSWGEESVLVPDAEAAIALLSSSVAPDDVVLVKASQSIGLWRVGEALLESTGSAGRGSTTSGGVDEGA